jgi:prolyl 4-hydroxylase
MIPRLKRHKLLPRQVLVIDSFVSEEVCGQILDDLESSYWHSSSVLQLRSGRQYSEVREHFRASATADQRWFGPKLNRIIGRIQKRLSILLPCDPLRLESWQATRYKKGGRFDYHVDGGYWKRSAAGDRKRTYLIYLDSPQKGGETHFRALNITVAAKPGRLVVWENLLPSGHCDHAMIHGGMAVLKGTKTTLVTWERERSLGKEGE